MYSKQFDIRWSDIDANKHLGNSSYVDFMSHTRMSFLQENGISLEVMNGLNLGPVALYEHIYYYREVLSGDPISVSLDVCGYTNDGRFIKIEHNFFDREGRNLASSEMLFSWIDITSRKLGRIPEELLVKIRAFPKAENFKILSNEDIRKHQRKPKDLT